MIESNPLRKQFVSLRCPLNNGCYTDRQFKVFGQWMETSISTPVKYRCHGMRGVCMIMGIVISTVHTKKRILFSETLPLKNSLSKLKSSFFSYRRSNLEAFTISCRTLRGC